MTDAAKKAVAERAAEFIENGMLVGLGSGSTARFFIEGLAKRCKEGLKIQAAASSESSCSLAKKLGIPLLELEKITTLDITVDGADEIDGQKRMIKGGGGAFVREKILAAMSREMVVIVDESKLVSQLGACKLPVEVLPFAYNATAHHIVKSGYQGEFRKNPDRSFTRSDSQNFIFDITFAELCSDPEREHETLVRIPGVVDTGFFFNLAGRVLIGFFDGQIVIQP